MSDMLDNFQITTWYKAVVAIFAPAFLIVLVAQRDAPAVLFAGALLVGLGEWVNHPKRETQYRPTTTGQVAMISDVPRKWTVVGTIVEATGVALIVFAAYLLVGCRLWNSVMC